jgi:hypothetical protein
MNHFKKYATAIVATSSIFLLSGCGIAPTTPATIQTPVPTPTAATASPTRATTPPPVVIANPVNACEVFQSAQVDTALHSTSSTKSGYGTPVQGGNQNMYSNCKWTLTSNHTTLEVHTETYASHQGASDIITTDLADDRGQGGTSYDFVMEPTLGPEAYFRQDQKTTMFSFAIGNTFYSLYLKNSSGLDKTTAREQLKQLAQTIH